MHTASARFVAAAALGAAALAGSAGAGELTVDLGDGTETSTTERLLARPDAATVEVPLDATYRRPMSHRADAYLAHMAGRKERPSGSMPQLRRTGNPARRR
jgi:hypothetical protein